ncbi:ABC transporter ATP-binding protein [Shouchella miscanthi]|uniref:ABC transporter ATP-binding protein n=1 Tax=Shouchella miscanthi TaxID=2598861 RepID=A0ABU6NRG7_9BACI|nr:ABC transporter ATP-binding protein [Shouchella miscanthi]
MLQLRDMKKRYKSATETIEILAGITISIEKGQWITLTGPSGSGKTTFLKCLSGIEPIDEGDILFEDISVSKATEEEKRTFRREKLGYIFQDYKLFDQFDALTNVFIPLLPFEEQHVLEKRANELLEKVGLGHRTTHLPSQLSGGEKQRVGIARALMNHPSLLICDEPTGNLDNASRNAIMGLLKTLHQEGTTIILVTHDTGLAAYGDRLIEMKDGYVYSSEVIKN